MNAIEIKGLKKKFHQKRGQKTVEAVKGITLSVEAGEIFGFLGPNGAGKSTCLHMLTTLLPIDDGEAKIGEYDIKKNPKEVRRCIGYVGQLGGADIEATGRENLILSGILYGMSKKDIYEQSELLIDLLDLRELIDRVVKTYSGGQRRRLEIALGILHKPDVLFLDEPTAGLDPQNRANVWEHIRKLNLKGMTIFLTTHYLEEADEFCNRICIIDKGVIVAKGTPQSLKREILGDVVSIKPKDDKVDIAHMFADNKNIFEIHVESGKTNLYVKDGAIAMPEIFIAIKKKNIELESLSFFQPSLDDVFLRKTGKSLRDTGKDGSQ